MTLDSLKKLYTEQLKDLHSAETQLAESLPTMANAATSSELRQAFERHHGQTREHVQRLERLFADLGEAPGGHTCKAMQGLIAESEETVQAHGDPAVKDAALIAAAQRVEHYEIAGYGTARTFANHLELSSHADILQQTLDEEGETDKNLTALAEGNFLSGGINEEAEAAATRSH